MIYQMTKQAYMRLRQTKKGSLSDEAIIGYINSTYRLRVEIVDLSIIG